MNLAMRTSRKLLVMKWLTELRIKIRLDTQKMRMNLIYSMEEIFNLAKDFARGTVKASKLR